MIRADTHAGFTLLELLVAIAIFSFLGAATFTAINQIVIEREIVSERAGQLKDMQRAVRYLNTDLSQLHPRPVRDELGRDKVGALLVDTSEEFALLLTRDGWRNPTLQRRGTLQRVRYRLEETTLLREYWPVLDRMLGDEPRSLELMQDIEEFDIAFLNEENEWVDIWPPAADEPDSVISTLPRAVRYRFTHKGFGEIERLVEVAR